ncbi:hypothetical protein FB45DRAFT_1052524 [Roridomyces roridus]|uniref:F-box domain-containing protein n=1 Tax=Roridomyces roridus TaxID=1738132 RepID=A0AAD7CA12_9AGAR|nr:hypothetical protein FB45DRAFT_1052524 [Roridomyces roridus]
MVCPAHLCPQCGFDIVHAPAYDSPTRLRCRLSELESLIAALTAERDALQAQSDAIVYPVLSLPLDITSQIFQTCTCVNLDSGMSILAGERIMPLVFPRPANAPLLLTQVCREWRQIALANPSLWRSLYLVDALPPEAVDTWLLRAGNLPLAYHMLCYGLEPRLVALAKTSIAHAARWQDAQFKIPPDTLAEFDFGQQLLPHLRHLSLDMLLKSTAELRWKGVPSVHIPQKPESLPTDSQILPSLNLPHSFVFRDITICIGNAPLLVDVHLCLILRGVKVELPWLQLTALTLRAMDLSECITLVAQCLQLQKLDISGITGATDPCPPFIMPHLQSLRSNWSNNTILAHVTLPRLEVLTVIGGNTLQDVEVITELARRSDFPLQRLGIAGDTRVSVQILRSCLAALPASVDHLTLDYRNAPGIDTLAVFSWLNGADLFPRLQHLTLHCHSAQRLPEQNRTFVDILQKRRSTLELVDVVLSLPHPLLPAHMPGEAVMDQLRALALAGMKIRVKIRGTKEDVRVAFDSTWCVLL